MRETKETIKFENGKRHHMKASDVITCETHNVKVKYGNLDDMQKAAFLDGLDTVSEHTCLLLQR